MCSPYFGDPDSTVYSLKEDMARIGKPMEETLVSVLTDHVEERSMYLFNQAVCLLKLLLGVLTNNHFVKNALNHCGCLSGGSGN